MKNRLLKDESGFSIVELMVALVILVIAIIPMVRMFDVALGTTESTNRYDQARALANRELEILQSLPYESVASFPPCNVEGEEYECEEPDSEGEVLVTAYPDSEPYGGLVYKIETQHVEVADPTSDDWSLTESDEETGILRLTIDVLPDEDSEEIYSVTGVVSR